MLVSVIGGVLCEGGMLCEGVGCYVGVNNLFVNDDPCRVGVCMLLHFFHRERGLYKVH